MLQVLHSVAIPREKKAKTLPGTGRMLPPFRTNPVGGIVRNLRNEIFHRYPESSCAFDINAWIYIYICIHIYVMLVMVYVPDAVGSIKSCGFVAKF